MLEEKTDLLSPGVPSRVLQREGQELTKRSLGLTCWRNGRTSAESGRLENTWRCCYADLVPPLLEMALIGNP